MSLDQSWKGAFKAGGFSLVAAGFFLFLFFIALLILQTSPTLTPEMILDNPLPPVSLYSLAAFGELLLMPGMLGLYFALKNVKKTHVDGYRIVDGGGILVPCLSQSNHISSPNKW